jgi:hypothetical protein
MGIRYQGPSIFHADRLNSSVGACGLNDPAEVEKIQKLIKSIDYSLFTGRNVNITGRCDYATIEAIRWLQQLLRMSPTGLVSPVDIAFMQALRHMGQTWRPANTSGTLIVEQGQFTFDNEGCDYLTAVPPFRQHKQPYFSRILHWPETIHSGVTIGRGYDMGNRDRTEIYATLRHATFDDYRAELCSRAAGMKGPSCDSFVTAYGPLVGEITHQQQVNLFNISFRTYITTAERIYARIYPAGLSWSDVDQKVKDVFYDTLYQGNTGASDMAKIISSGKKSELVNWLRAVRPNKDTRRDNARIVWLR